jgi:hypothetical protein
MNRLWIVLFAIVLCAGSVAGCATAHSIQSARAQLAKAKGAGAERSAPFEYYAAQEYLGKAVFSAEIGDPRQADVLTAQSAAYSAKALELAGGGAK